MIPIVFINSRSVPFVDMIINSEKIFETRSRNVLRFLFESGQRFLIAETGNRKPLVRCSARIKGITVVYTKEAWNSYRLFHSVPVGSEFDWKPGTKKKVMYQLDDVRSVPVPFNPPEGKRHGRTWMELSCRLPFPSTAEECEQFFTSKKN